MVEIIKNNPNLESYDQQIAVHIEEDSKSLDNRDIEFMEVVTADKKPGFEDIGHGILVYKDYLGETDSNFFKFQAEALNAEEWETHPSASYFKSKISTNLRIESFTSTFIDLMMPEYWTNCHQTINRLRVGDDPMEFGWTSWGSADYFIVYYFGEWEGGEITLLRNDKEDIDFTFKPQHNELYLLPLLNKERYISSDVSSGIKYSFIDWLYRHSEWAIP